MKKLIFIIISTTFISSLYANSSEVNKTITTKQKNALTLEMCKKKMGIDNFNFIKEVFNDENTLLLKCKEALSK
ncbi:MAG: hypothetical protein ACPG9K_04540 [Poseidonibacter sp.]